VGVVGVVGVVELSIVVVEVLTKRQRYHSLWQ